MQYTGTINNISLDYTTKKPIVSLLLNCESGIDELRDTKLDIEIKKHKEKRSTNANAYMRTLCQKLAEKLRDSTKEEVYRKAIREIGQFKVKTIYEKMPLSNESVDRYIEIWQSNGIGWICEKIGDSKLTGYTNVMCYYGSSHYTKEEMSLLIDNIVTECKEQGIEIKTPDELNKMIGEWNKC